MFSICDPTTVRCITLQLVRLDRIVQCTYSFKYRMSRKFLKNIIKKTIHNSV